MSFESSSAPTPATADMPEPGPMSLLFDSESSLSDCSSSDLSSLRSSSPERPYPSPESFTQPEKNAPSTLNKSRKRLFDSEGNELPREKRQRIAKPPKPRTTSRLDFISTSSEIDDEEQKYAFEKLMKVLRKRRKIVVVAGAGMSVSAGVPDFRSATGLFKTLKAEHGLKASGKQLFDASVYQTESATSSFHDMVRNLSTLVNSAEPTAFHRMLSELGKEGRLLRLYTQNVDGIDTALPGLETTVPLSTRGPWPRTVQLHGGLEKMVCSKCNVLTDFAPDLFNGPLAPPCDGCIEADRVRTDHAGKRSHGVGRLRPRIVLYNEANPDDEAIGACVASDLRTRPDAIIVVGTSMKIPGVRRIVREMCGVVRSRKDGLSVWINQDSPPSGKEFDDSWDVVVKGPCDEVARCWSENSSYSMLCTNSDVEAAKDKGEIRVVIPAKAEYTLPSPAASPQPKVVKPLALQKLDGKPQPKTKAKARNGEKSAKKISIKLKPREKSPINSLRKTMKITKSGIVQSTKLPAEVKSKKPKAIKPEQISPPPEDATSKIPEARDIPAKTSEEVRLPTPVSPSLSESKPESIKERMAKTESPKIKPRGMERLID